MIPEDELIKTVHEIAEQLHETTQSALSEIYKYLDYFGIEETFKIVAKALEIEANGGMTYYRFMKLKRYTLGGIFFHLASERWRVETGYEEELKNAVQIVAEQLHEPAKRLKGVPNEYTPLDEIRDFLDYFGIEETYKICLLYTSPSPRD